MASKQANSEDGACFVCFDIFQPIPMPCGHNFCKSCLQQSWAKEGCWGCPMCQSKSPRKELPKSRVLDHLCKQLQKLDPTQRPDLFCSQHDGEQLQFFCHTDNKLTCGTCQASKEHEHHNYSSIEKAAQTYKGMVKVLTEPLQRHIQILENAQQAYNEAAKKMKIETLKTQREMREQFTALHSFLYEEELSRTVALRREEEHNSWQIGENIERMSEEISLLSERIELLEHEMWKDDVTFLQNLDSTMDRLHQKLDEPEIPSGALIDMDKYLENLQYNVWMKMKGIVQHGLQLEDLRCQEDLKDYQADFGATDLQIPLAIPEDLKCAENLNDCPEASTARDEESSLPQALPTTPPMTDTLAIGLSTPVPQPDTQQHQVACTLNNFSWTYYRTADPNPPPVTFLPEHIPPPVVFFPNNTQPFILMPNNAASQFLYAPDPTLPQHPIGH